MTESKAKYPTEHPNLVILADQYVSWKHIESLVDDLKKEVHFMYSNNRDITSMIMFLEYDAKSHIRAIEDILHNIDREALE